MTALDGQSGLVGQLLKLMLPGARPIPVAPARIGRDEQGGGVGGVGAAEFRIYSDDASDDASDVARWRRVETPGVAMDPRIQTGRLYAREPPLAARPAGWRDTSARCSSSTASTAGSTRPTCYCPQREHGNRRETTAAPPDTGPHRRHAARRQRHPGGDRQRLHDRETRDRGDRPRGRLLPSSSACIRTTSATSPAGGAKRSKRFCIRRYKGRIPDFPEQCVGKDGL